MSAPALLIRADASAARGAGHVMRSLAVAQAAVDAGMTAAFALAEEAPAVETLLRAQNMEVVRLAAPAGSPADAAALCTSASERAAAVVLDGYHFDAAYQDRIKTAGLYLCCIDDYGHAERYAADLVVNQNPGYAEEARYARRSPSTRLLLGPAYALLRREFAAQRAARGPAPAQARRILVTMGGTDDANLTQAVLEDLEPLAAEELEITVIVGGDNPNAARIDALAARSKLRLRVLRNVAEMPQRMAAAQLAVTAGGITSYELAYMGVPAVVVAATEVQAPVARLLHEQGVCWFAGSAHEMHPGIVREPLAALLRSAERRAEMAARGRSMFDGRGAARVTQAIASGMEP